MVPVKVGGFAERENRYVERQRPFQKLVGEYLLETMRSAMESEPESFSAAGGLAEGFVGVVG